MSQQTTGQQPPQPAQAGDPQPASAGTPSEAVHRLPHDPVHLFQLSTEPGTYNNPMGCGAFSTSMALSYYDAARFGTYDSAHAIFDAMLKVPFFGGTFESQNAAIAHKYGFFAAPFDHGTVADLAAAIDLGAPTVLLINPKTFLSIGEIDIVRVGQHDVLLVGYSVDAQGKYLNLFINNPWQQSGTQTAPAGLAYPGNQTITVAEIATRWSYCFTPFFQTAATFTQWRKTTHRG